MIRGTTLKIKPLLLRRQVKPIIESINRWAMVTVASPVAPTTWLPASAIGSTSKIMSTWTRLNDFEIKTPLAAKNSLITTLQDAQIPTLTLAGTPKRFALHPRPLQPPSPLSRARSVPRKPHPSEAVLHLTFEPTVITRSLSYTHLNKKTFTGWAGPGGWASGT